MKQYELYDDNHTMRTIDVTTDANHATLIQSCIVEYEQVTGHSICNTLDFKQSLLPWIFSNYGVDYNSFFDEDGDEALCSVTITDEKKYMWYLLKHSI